MAKKQELNLGGLMKGVSTRLSDAMEEAESAVSAPVNTPSEPSVQNEQEQPEVAENHEAEITTAQGNKFNNPVGAEDPEPTTKNDPPKHDVPQIDLSIDDDISMYAGITKPVSFALPKEIKRALDNFVDDYNDSRTTNKTTQAKVVAQALRNFLKDYQ